MAGSVCAFVTLTDIVKWPSTGGVKITLRKQRAGAAGGRQPRHWKMVADLTKKAGLSLPGGW